MLTKIFLSKQAPETEQKRLLSFVCISGRYLDKRVFQVFLQKCPLEITTFMYKDYNIYVQGVPRGSVLRTPISRGFLPAGAICEFVRHLKHNSDWYTQFEPQKRF